LVASSKVKVIASAGGFHFALTTSSEELAEAHAGQLFDEITSAADCDK